MYRVMLLGPSFAYGWGVDYEQSFAATLERELEAPGVAHESSLAVRIRIRSKNLATVFYAWTLWSQWDARRGAPETGRQVLGAGREMSSPTRFDPASPQVAAALQFYRDLERVVRRDDTRLMILYFPWPTRSIPRMPVAGGTWA